MTTLWVIVRVLVSIFVGFIAIGGLIGDSQGYVPINNRYMIKASVLGYILFVLAILNIFAGGA